MYSIAHLLDLLNFYVPIVKLRHKVASNRDAQLSSLSTPNSDDHCSFPDMSCKIKMGTPIDVLYVS